MWLMLFNSEASPPSLPLLLTKIKIMLYFSLVLAALIAIIAFKSIVIVPHASALVVERLGKYNETLSAGLHILIPFLDRVAYKLLLKETPYDTTEQEAITADNVSIVVDGVLYFQVTTPKDAAYGTTNFRTAIEMLAKTTLRSEIGKRALDTLLEERASINAAIVTVLDQASQTWGVKVLRYELKDITLPESIQRSMQLQMTAERERRALVARSEGEKQAAINKAQGEREASIAESEGQKQAAINRADGEAYALIKMAEASASSIAAVGKAIQLPGGQEAISLKVAEEYVHAFSNIAKESTTVVVPGNMGDIASMITSAMAIVGKKS